MSNKTNEIVGHEYGEYYELAPDDMRPEVIASYASLLVSRLCGRSNFEMAKSGKPLYIGSVSMFIDGNKLRHLAKVTDDVSLAGTAKLVQGDVTFAEVAANPDKFEAVK